MRLDNLLFFGIQNSTAFEQKDKIQISNFIAGFLAAIILLYSFIFWKLEYSAPIPFGRICIIFASLLTLTPILNYKKRYIPARLNLILISSISIWLFSIYLGFDSHIFLYFFSLMILPLLLFTYEQRSYIFLSYFIIFTLLIADVGYKMHDQKILQDQTMSWLAISNIVTVFIFICLYNYLFLKQKQKQDEYRNAKNEELKKLLEEKEANAEILLKAKEAAESVSKSKENFLSSMSHELRTPLNAVIGITNLLITSDPKEEQIENLNIMKFSADNLLSLINDILDYNKISAGKLEIESIPFDLIEHVKNLKEANSFKAKEKENTIKLLIDPSIPKLVKGDPTRLAQILNNLISNGIKFTDKGKIEIRIYKEGGSDNNRICFEVEDNGIGIKKENQTKIFKDFEQEESSTSRKFGGTGLGLSITKKLLQLMDSEIRVKSEFGQGSNFYFTLNMEPVAEIDEPFEVKENRADHNQLKNKKVLLVEDNPFNIKVAEQFLKKWELDYDLAENGEEAVHKVKENSYDLILMDLQMPVMDGYTATEKIRTFDSKTPILALTASALIEVKQKVKKAGMNGSVTKPFVPQELREELIQILAPS
ncbi:ATP-binding protein [Persicobacter sp. CCB-QB2]|uniref:ATP-binding protein n=1 Tax=Persicobacter sp. CCB-QB2 TaxID=1561025 RepID=UPI0006A9CA9B|nr:ATP-binding protein [Persicobacter sp. CCB-QB2]